MTDQSQKTQTVSSANVVPTKKKQSGPVSFNNPQYQEVYAWLCQTYPKAFIPTRVRILAIGIHKKILEQPDLPFSKMRIRKFLAKYCGSRVYLRHMIGKKHRINLGGEDVANLTEAEKEDALLKLRESWKKNQGQEEQQKDSKNEGEKTTSDVQGEAVSGSDTV